MKVPILKGWFIMRSHTTTTIELTTLIHCWYYMTPYSYYIAMWVSEILLWWLKIF